MDREEVEDKEPFFDPVRGEPDEGSEFPWLLSPEDEK